MKVLFIGNSHTYFNDMPHLFSLMCGELTGEKADVTMLAYSNRALSWHKEEYFSLRFALMYGSYDYCVIQQQAHPFPGEETTFRYAKFITGLCERFVTKPVIFETWAEKKHPENFPQMKACYEKLAEEAGAMLIPAGELFDEISRDHPDIDLYWKDGAHASPYGDYLIALSLAALLCGAVDLSGISSRGIDFNVDFTGDKGHPVAGIDPEAASVMLDEDKTARIKDAVEHNLIRE